jgi:pSer/pThr/pTyr-binding forkhead associated (FHA) protein
VSPGAGPPIALPRPVLLIGRHPDCDIRLDLPSISRRHCCVAVAYDRMIIRDLGSRCGLLVNGVKVTELQIRNGDEIAIGPLIFRLEGAPDVSPTTDHVNTPVEVPQSEPPPSGSRDSSEVDLIPVSGLFPEV